MTFFGILRSRRGFTVTELLLATSLLTSIPVSSYIGVKNRAYQTVCLNNLRQIGQVIMTFAEDEGFPNARFFPDDPLKDPRSIVNILADRGVPAKSFICPTAPPVLSAKGLTYLWNDTLSGRMPAQLGNPSGTWMMIDITALDDRVASHPGGYDILYADGHVACVPNPPPLLRQ